MKILKKLLKIAWNILGFCYIPIFLLAWILHKIARITLAISYYLMFEPKMAKDIIINLFKYHGRL